MRGAAEHASRPTCDRDLTAEQADGALAAHRPGGRRGGLRASAPTSRNSRNDVRCPLVVPARADGVGQALLAIASYRRVKPRGCNKRLAVHAMKGHNSPHLLDGDARGTQHRFTMTDDMDGMAVFAAVAEARNFRGAGDRLGVTASAVSQALRRLEERLGVTLVQRSTRSVRLTEAGERLYEAV